jgi:hypothetical protein
MKPDDSNGQRPQPSAPTGVLIVAAQLGAKYNCPGVDSKPRA